MTASNTDDGDGNVIINTMAILIKHNGKEIPVFPENKKFFKLREVQEIIGGEIDIFPIKIDSVMIVHRNCDFMQFLVNSRAILIAYQNDVFRCITGDALICAATEIE